MTDEKELRLQIPDLSTRQLVRLELVRVAIAKGIAFWEIKQDLEGLVSLVIDGPRESVKA